MFAAVVVPLFGCFYSPGTPSPRAAFVSVVAGVVTRVVLEFSIPKDGLYILPYDGDEFYDYGPAASSKLPVFFDAPADDLWDPATEPCVQEQLKDFLGVDSLSAFLAGLLAFVGVAMAESAIGRPLFSFGGLEAYEKELTNETKDETELTRKAGADADSDEKQVESSSDDKADEAQA